MDKSTKSKVVAVLKLVAKFVFAFGIIAYLIYDGRLDLNVVKQGFSNPQVVATSLGLIFLGSLAGFTRWSLLLRAQDVYLKPLAIARYGFIGLFFNTFMPGVVSGDVIKAWYVISDREKGQEKTPILTAIIIDRIFGLFGLIVLSLFALFLHWNQVWAIEGLRSVVSANLVLGFLVATFFSYVLLSNWGPFLWFRSFLNRYKNRKIGALFIKAYDAWSSYRYRPFLLLCSLLLACCTHTCIVVAILFCSRALGETGMEAHQIFLLAPLGLLSTALPVAPAGLGVGHVVFAMLFGWAGSQIGAEIFTLFISLQIIVNLTGVVFYVSSPKPMRLNNTPSVAPGMASS